MVLLAKGSICGNRTANRRHQAGVLRHPQHDLSDARMGALAVPQIRRYALGPASRRLDIRGDVLFGRADALALPPQTCRPVPK